MVVPPPGPWRQPRSLRREAGDAPRRLSSCPEIDECEPMATAEGLAQCAQGAVLAPAPPGTCLPQPVWSSAVWAGRRGEDRTVAVQRPWPAGTSSCAVQRSMSLGRSLPQSTVRRPSYALFALFDGHNGAEAARFCAHTVTEVVEAFLPPRLAPGLFPDGEEEEEGGLAAALQQALALAALELERQYACAGLLGGCTATLALQTGRLLTVASLGSSACELDVGWGSPLVLSADHRISHNARDRHRLVAAGCHVAALDAAGTGPAPVHCRGSGTLRIWPGGLTLSRSIGDFCIGPAVLPLPHIKQVLLPPSGGRLVLACDAVWSRAGEAVQAAMRGTPVKTAAHAVVRAVSTSCSSGVDASVVVADLLPPGDTFPELCQRLQQHRGGAEAAAAQGLGKRGVLRVLGGVLRKPKAAAAQPTQPPAAPGPPEAATALLADFDTAELLGLVPLASGETQRSRSSSRVPTPTLSRTSSATAGSLTTAAATAKEAVGNAAALVAVAPPAEEPPLWFAEEIELQMRSVMSEAHQLWRLARRQRRDASLALLAAQRAEQAHQGAEEGEEGLQRRGSSSDPDLARLEQAAATGMLPTAPGSPPGSGSSTASQAGPEPSAFAAALSAAAPQRPPLSPLSQAPLALHSLLLSDGERSGALLSLPPTPAAGQDRDSGATGSTRSSDEEDAASEPGQTALRWSSTLASAGGLAHARAGSLRRSLSTPAADPNLASPRRSLPPLHLPHAAQLGLQPPGGAHRGSSRQPGGAGAQPTPGSAAGGSARPPLPRSKSSGASLQSMFGSRAPFGPPTPRTPLDAAAAKLSQPGQGPQQLATSPNTRWLTAYSLAASQFTKRGSGSMRRNTLS